MYLTISCQTVMFPSHLMSPIEDYNFFLQDYGLHYYLRIVKYELPYRTSEQKSAQNDYG